MARPKQGEPEVSWMRREEAVLAAIAGKLRLNREGVIAIVALGVAWEVLARVTGAQQKVPSWGIIAEHLLQVRLVDVAVTLERVLVAILVAFAVGSGGAVLLYLSRRAERYLMPLVRMVMAIPVISWILFSVLWFPGVELRIFFILLVVGAPVFLVDVFDGLRSIPKELRDMFLSFRPRRGAYIRKLLLPGALQPILTSWKINLSLAIRVVTIAELVGAVTGIGAAMNNAFAIFNVAPVFAHTLVLIGLLLGLGLGVSTAEARLLRWRE